MKKCCDTPDRVPVWEPRVRRHTKLRCKSCKTVQVLPQELRGKSTKR